MTAPAPDFDAAREAAHNAWLEQPDAKGAGLEQYLRAALEAAAPYMRAATYAEAWIAGSNYPQDPNT